MPRERDTIFERLGNVLRVEGEDLTHAPLPRRWVDLILYLDEQERKSAEHDPSRPTN